MDTDINYTFLDVEDAERKPCALEINTRPVQEIGRGMRAKVFEVCVRTHDGLIKHVAMKSFNCKGGADAAARGYEYLRANLPEVEKEKLIKDFYVDTRGNRIFLEIPENTWVVSMGKNESRDRTELTEAKLKTIPNFSVCVAGLLDAMEKAGEKALSIGPDVYFFTINRATGEMSYVYGDTETASHRPNFSYDAVPIMNLYWAGGALNHFLHECVEDPDMYLARVHKEVMYRMYSYGWANPKDIDRFQKDFTWPTLNWKQSFIFLASWLGTLFKRQVVSAWKT